MLTKTPLRGRMPEELRRTDNAEYLANLTCNLGVAYGDFIGSLTDAEKEYYYKYGNLAGFNERS